MESFIGYSLFLCTLKGNFVYKSYFHQNTTTWTIVVAVVEKLRIEIVKARTCHDYRKTPITDLQELEVYHVLLYGVLVSSCIGVFVCRTFEYL